VLTEYLIYCIVSTTLIETYVYKTSITTRRLQKLQKQRKEASCQRLLFSLLHEAYPQEQRQRLDRCIGRT